ncbi:MAG: HlyC/CorC family transporter [Cryobacterium sp.]|nr:HlyC/CorC family transporter [Cryobacterium sp.]MCO5294211.1 hemolysin family protein [Homoserinimonas sp.]
MIFVMGISAVALVGIGGWLAAADSALGVLSRSNLLELAESSRASGSLKAIAGDISAHSNAANFVRVVAETTAAVLVTLTLAYRLDWWWALLASALIMTLVSFVLVGSSPRAFGRFHAEGVVKWSARLIRACRLLLGPIASALVAFGDRVIPGKPRNISFSSEEQLLSMVDEATEMDVLEEDDRELIHSIFEFNDTVVREVMVPRTDMVTVEAGTAVQEAMALFLKHGISRMPVVGEDADEVVGVLYLRDVSRHLFESEDRSAPVEKLSRPAVYVPESQKVDDLLRQMQSQSNHLAMVIDEYGGIAGLVTMEDVIEELVGEISDEYDRGPVEVQAIEEGKFRVSARLPIDELGDLFDLELEDEDVDTVGGLLVKELGRFPQPGSSVETSGIRLTAERIEAHGTRLKTVIVEAVAPDGQEVAKED